MRTVRVAATALSGALLLLSRAAPVPAQEYPPVAVGDRVRVKVPDLSGKRMTGTLVGMTAQTWEVALQGGDSVLVLPVEAITRVDVSRGKKSWAARGALIGLAAANVFVYVEAEVNGVGDEDLRAVAATVLGIPAAGLGALIGLNFEHDRWKKAPIPAHPVAGVGPQGSWRIGLRVPVGRR